MDATAGIGFRCKPCKEFHYIDNGYKFPPHCPKCKKAIELDQLELFFVCEDCFTEHETVDKANECCSNKQGD